MKRILIYLLVVWFAVTINAQSIPSIRIHTPENKEGWLYDIADIDSITYNDAGQVLHMGIDKIEYPISEIDSVTFLSDATQTLNICFTLKNDTAVYILNPNGYIRLCGDADMCLTELDAYINGVVINMRLENGNIKSIHSDSLDLIIDKYSDYEVIICRCWDKVFHTIFNSKQPMNRKRASNWSYATKTDLMKTLMLNLANEIKNKLAVRELIKKLGIELKGTDSYENFMRKYNLRVSIRELDRMMGQIQKIQRLEDFEAEDIIKEIEKLPDMDGMENAFYFAEYIDPTSFVAYYNQLLRLIKDLQDKNKEIERQRENKNKKSFLLCDIHTGETSGIMDRMAQCSMNGYISGVAYENEVDYDYGIAYSTNTEPTIDNNVHVNNNNISSMNITNSTFTLTNLLPNTLYYYRAYVKDNISGEVYYAEEIKYFRTNRSLPVTINKFEQASANYYPQHFIYNGKNYDFKFNTYTYITLDDDTNVQDWGYYYVDPDGVWSEPRSLKQYPSKKVKDGGFAYCRNTYKDKVTLVPYVQYTDEEEQLKGQPVTFDIEYPETTNLTLTNCTFMGTATDQTHNGRTWKYMSSFRFDYDATGAYWLKVGVKEMDGDDSGWSGWQDELQHQMVSCVDGANSTTVNYYYNDKEFFGQYKVQLEGKDDTNGNHCKSQAYVTFSYADNQFTGCTLQTDASNTTAAHSIEAARQRTVELETRSTTTINKYY